MYYQGDYYQGDPGLFGDIWGGIKKVGGYAIDVASTFNPAVGIARKAVGTIFNRPAQPKFAAPRGVQPRITAPPTIVPPTMTFAGKGVGQVAISPTTGLPIRKRRRMNVTNDKALRRAVRRTDGFVKLAKRALRGTGYTVVTKSSRARKVSVRESGPGGVTVH